MFGTKKSKVSNTLTFNVGPWKYRCSIAPGPILSGDEYVMVVWLETSQEILISSECPAERRRAEALYAVIRAWVAHTGEPRKMEDWCDFSATVLESFCRDVAGDPGAFERMSTAA